MSEIKIPFSGRAHHFTEDEIATVVHAMRTADPLTQGHFLKEFEKTFSEYVSADNCFAVCNATAALEITAQLCCFEPGDEIVIPLHTFTASAYPFVKKGATIRWADIDPQTRVVTPETLRACITPKTKALLVVHLYGYIAQMDEITRLAKEHNLILIEDTAQALGGLLNGQHAGTFGDFGIYSFHSHKNVTTLGEGGILRVKNPEMAALVPMLRHNGHCGFTFDREDYWIPAMGNVDLPEWNGHQLMPNNYCIGEVECALGTKLLQRIDDMNEKKRRRACDIIDRLAKDAPELIFHKVTDDRHTYHLLVAQVAEGKRDAFIRKMFAEKGVKCVVQYCPLNRYPFYQKTGFGEASCPNTDLFFDNMVSFPFQEWMSDDDIDYMVSSSIEVLQSLR